MSYSVSVQVISEDGSCDLNFTHKCNGPEIARLAKQFASLVASGGVADSGEHKVGRRVTADAFENPSSIFARVTRTAPKMDVNIAARAPQTRGSAHAAIFGDDEADYNAAAAELQLGNFTPTAYDVNSLRQ